MTQLVKESACHAGDLGSIPGLERSAGEGKGYPLQYSGLEGKGIRNTVCVCVCVCVCLGACLCPASQDPQIVLISGVFSLTTHSV